MEKAKMINLLSDLMQQEINIIHIYDEAIEGVKDPVVRDRLAKFKQTHDRHVRNLSQAVRELGDHPPSPSRDLQGAVSEKVAKIRSSMSGTEGALKALGGAEEKLGDRYRTLVPDHMPDATTGVLKQHLSDQKLHLDYINLNIKSLP
jgi:uncharacterized protein (TIGR02284 family)